MLLFPVESLKFSEPQVQVDCHMAAKLDLKRVLLCLRQHKEHKQKAQQRMCLCYTYINSGRILRLPML